MLSRRSILFALFPFATFLACSDAKPSPQTGDDDLIGGRVAEEGEFPATMQVRGNCTVSKVGPRHVLTAAHCINSMFYPGARIELSAKKNIGRFSDGDSGFRTYTVERVEMEPRWATSAAPRAATASTSPGATTWPTRPSSS